MKIAYLDCFSGMSGDMFLGALVDAGVSPELLEKTVEALHVGARLEISKVDRSGITATKVDVFVNGEKESPRDEFFAEHEHSHEHEHDKHATGPDRHHDHGPVHAHGRNLKEIKNLIASAAISETAKTTATAIFQALGEAEAKIHNMDIDSVHFHEVGAVDAIVDIVGAAVGAEALGVDEIACSALNVGGGTVKCAHGVFPVPAPATVELLKDIPIYSSGIQKELVTPTGAAIVKTLVTRFGDVPAMKIETSGYGAGSCDIAGHPNVVRLVIGEAIAAQNFRPGAETRPSVVGHTTTETISVLEANLDDLNPQVFGYVMDRLLEEGALDAFGMPVQMKKNRPGMLLTVLCKPQDADRLTHFIFTETTTLGVRRRDEQRQTLSRRWVNVATPWGDVRMKIASMNGTVINYAPEYEDCRKLATEQRVPLKQIMNATIEAYSKTR
jgi:uncharacterized protein (TIGR00299 family) protein